MRVFVPRDEEEARAWIEARGAGEALQIRARVGVDSKPEPEESWSVETQGLNRLLFFDPDDMVVGVEAGMPAIELQKLLASHGMRLPVNPWRYGESLGALTAANHFGPERMTGGGVRDYLIGIHYIDGFARLVKAGGKVVKNVTGYDLCRMMIGSRGDFGLITRLNFKLVPAREHTQFCRLTAKGADGPAALARLFAAKLSFDWGQAHWCGEKGWIIGLGLAGAERSQVRLVQEMRAMGLAPEVLEEADLPFDDPASEGRRMDGFLEPWLQEAKVHLHWVAPAYDLLTKPNWEQWLADLRRDGAGESLVLHPFGADLHWFGPATGMARAIRHVTSAGAVLCRAESKEALPDLPKVAIHPMHRVLKRGLDPNGRYVST